MTRLTYSEDAHLEIDGSVNTPPESCYAPCSEVVKKSRGQSAEAYLKHYLEVPRTYDEIDIQGRVSTFTKVMRPGTTLIQKDLLIPGMSVFEPPTYARCYEYLPDEVIITVSIIVIEVYRCTMSHGL